MKETELNEKVIKLFEDFNSIHKISRSPLLYNELVKNGILFVGLNPSFNIKAINNMINNNFKKIIEVAELFDIKNVRKYSKYLLEIEEIAKRDYPYFNKFNEIANESKLEWEHVDIYFERETNQKELKEKYKSTNEYIKFALDQFELFEKLIDMINPKVIICVNALASQIIQEKCKTKIGVFTQAIGTYTFKVNNNQVPLFFSSMVTGQRALDNGSFERLKWHINFAINNLHFI